MHACVLDYVFPDGFPAGAFTDWADEQILGMDSASAFGADAPIRPPPQPNLKSAESIKGYLAELWRVSAASRKLLGAGKPAQDVYDRLQRIPVAKSPQAMIADMITAGPLLSDPLAGRWYENARSLQQSVKQATKEGIITAQAGSIAASIAAAVDQRLQSAARAAKKVVGAPVQAVRDVTAAADAAHARAVEAARQVATMPGDIVRSVTDVPKHFVSEITDTADKYLDTAKELAPQLAPFLADTAQSAASGMTKAAFGLGIGILAIGGLIIGGIVAVEAAPGLGMAAAAKGSRK